MLLFICNCGTKEGQLAILKNAIEKGVDSQTYPPHLVGKSGTIAAQLAILNNAIELTVDSQIFPPVDPSGGQGGTKVCQIEIVKNAIEKAVTSQMYPPGRGICWPRAVLHEVTFTFVCSFHV